jgi:hypothetical protein
MLEVGVMNDVVPTRIAWCGDTPKTDYGTHHHRDVTRGKSFPELSYVGHGVPQKMIIPPADGEVSRRSMRRNATLIGSAAWVPAF